MIELAQHIEVLLLENDCVIVPGFGGFISHYTPAERVQDEDIFLPPSRTIGFNPQLKMNDGMLVQSYMSVYDTNFSDASKMVEQEVQELVDTLYEEGKADLPNIGELHYTIHNTYEFTPYDNKLTTSYLYGLDSFEMKELAVLQKQDTDKVLSPVAKKGSYEIRINRTFLRNAVAVVAAIAFFFFLSTPVENTYVEKNNYAQLLPTDLFEKIEGQSIVMTPVATKQTATQKHPVVAHKKESGSSGKSHAKPVTVKEVKVAKKVVNHSQINSGSYHIIVASVVYAKDAEAMAEQLRQKGFSGAKALVGDGKVRVSILSCDTREEANRELLKLRENEIYKNAWMLAK